MNSRRFVPSTPPAPSLDEVLSMPEYDDALSHLPLREARRLVLDHFERSYLLAVLARCDGNVAEAARRSQVDRVTLFRAIRRYGLREG